MTPYLFGELDHRLAVVKRWSTVQTIRQQSVAEHSYNVAIMAERIAMRLFPNGYHPSRNYPIVGELLHMALHHDRLEAITGDFPSYMKRFVNEIDVMENVTAAKDDKDITEASDSGLLRFIIKCADYVDACVFLRMEVSLGNKSVEYHLRHLEQRFRDFVKDSSFDYGPAILELYKKDVIEKMFGGNGQYVSEIDGFPER